MSVKWADDGARPISGTRATRQPPRRTGAAGAGARTGTQRSTTKPGQVLPGLAAALISSASARPRRSTTGQPASGPSPWEIISTVDYTTVGRGRGTDR